MGAMRKVMQKLQDRPPTGGDGDGAPATPDTPLGSPARTQNKPTSPLTTDGRHSVFVPDARSGQQPDGGELGRETVSWDASKVDKALIAYHERYSAASEQYRSLRARLLNMNPEQSPQLIVITSSLPQEGKSVTAANLGMVMAEGGEHKVAIVDADFRRASLARMLGIDAQPGLAELIRGTAELPEALRPTQFPNLKIITAGACPNKRYGELVGAAALRTVLGRLRERFDYTFLDTPPVNTVSDVSMIAPHCDGAMIVIEMQRTSEPTVQEAVRTLQTTNVKILGCILSRYQRQRGHYYERYYSYYYND